MSQSGHFNKSIFRDKRGREIKHEDDFLSTKIRHADGTFGTYRAGKMIAKQDAPTDLSKFYKPTPVSTIVEKPAETETAGEKETAARVRKRFDVNAPSMRL
jgi:hypothetical protein